jgi:hypothetical protein
MLSVKASNEPVEKVTCLEVLLLPDQEWEISFCDRKILGLVTGPGQNF